MDSITSFQELSLNEMQDVVGGGFWGFVSGALTVVAGGFAAAACIADPEPVSKTYLAKSAACCAGAGLTAMWSALID